MKGKILKKKNINYREALVKRLRDLKECYVLDAGTGAGNMTKVLNDGLKASIVSVDANKSVFPYVYQKIDGNKVDFVVCDFSRLPFKNDAFCGVICDLVISTCENWQQAPILSEFNRALKPDSSLYITDYYPEKAPRCKGDRLAAETWKLYRAVSKAKGVRLKRDFPPDVTLRTLKAVGFHSVSLERVAANEGLEWKKKVFLEYYTNMKTEISSLAKSEFQDAFRSKLEELRREIQADGGMNWGWGVNYLVEARK